MNETFTAEEISMMRLSLVSYKRVVTYSGNTRETIEQIVRSIRELDTKLEALAPKGA